MPRWLISTAILLAMPGLAFPQDAGEPADEPEFGLRVEVVGDVVPGERWSEIISRNFHVMGNAGEERLRRVAADMELFREQVALLLPRAREVSSTPTRVVVFRDDGAYRPFRLADDGYLSAGDDVHYVVLSDSDPPRDVYRRYVRLLLLDSIAPLPRWLSEGLAEYYVTFGVSWFGMGFSDSRWIQVGGRDKEFNGLLRDPMPLEELFGVGEDSPQFDPEDPRNPFNATAWALVHYLLNAAELRQRSREFFDGFDAGLSAIESVESGYDRSLSRLEAGFREHIRDQTVPKLISGTGRVDPAGWFVSLAGFSLDETIQSLPVQFHSAASEAAFLGPEGSASATRTFRLPVNRDFIKAGVDAVAARILSEAETQHYRGDLLGRIGRPEDAGSILEFALRVDPDLGPAHVALGRLRVLEGRYDEAEALLARALDLDQENYLAHYEYASLMRAPGEPLSGDRLERARAALIRSLELAPEFVAAAEMLAGIDLERGEDLAATVELLEYAIRRSPGRQGLIDLLGEAWALSGGAPEGVPTVAEILALGPRDLPYPSGPAESGDVRAAALQVSQEFFPAEPDPEPVAGQLAVQSRFPTGEDPGDAAPSAPGAGEIVRLTPRPSVQGEQVRGLLTHLDCTDGLTVSLEVGDRVERFHTDAPETVGFFSYLDRVVDSLSCGPQPVPGIPARITYRPVPAGPIPILGEPLLIEIDAPR